MIKDIVFKKYWLCNKDKDYTRMYMREKRLIDWNEWKEKAKIWKQNNKEKIKQHNTRRYKKLKTEEEKIKIREYNKLYMREKRQNILLNKIKQLQYENTKWNTWSSI